MTSLSLQPDDGWKPIGTAPKDDWLLVFIPAEDGDMGRIHAGRNRKISNGYSWIIGHHFGHDLPGEPTHWRPLPDPPAALSQNTGASSNE